MNVRAINNHSPMTDQYAWHKLPSSRDKDSNPISNNHEENSHPNFDEAISKLPCQPTRSSTKRPPLQSCESSLNEGSPNRDYMPHAYLQKRSGGALLRSGYGSARNALEANHGATSRLYNDEEDVLSPSSTLSTKPGMPTPCHLDLGVHDGDSDNDTLYTVEGGYTPTNRGQGYYPEATAPPLSITSNDRISGYGYGGHSARKTVSSGSAYFAGGYSNEKGTNHCTIDEDDDDDHSGPKAKWNVSHVLQYMRSERSMSLSEQKKSR